MPDVAGQCLPGVGHAGRIALHGHMMTPGLVDGRVHPLSGGRSLAGCSLDYLAPNLALTEAALPVRQETIVYSTGDFVPRRGGPS
ncbi:hypothetical protein [Nguyenibacter vanlangensis]|uniref:Uncharacterized protein n=1 Tax=Nguyenibacter vanlangensis TaxID=1216886 RepID=A0A7Y7IW13_9PROT|nr:hypothetical protein [Nguyenibacter vanlangensis]NVN11374.1 hypothetical protein [Nguyenibacter vanlangensis]